MNKAQAKKLDLGRLASYLSREVIIDGVVEVQAAQGSLIAEFSRRAAGVEIPERFNDFTGS